MLFSKLLRASLCLSMPIASIAGAIRNIASQNAEARQQDIVTWDDKSLFINGERLMIFSGEVHPFRLPVPSLWLDILQKMKAAGYNCVSIYVDWHLLEAKRGEFRAEGNFALEPFFAAAKQAGLYVIARPGPYINAEVSGGGFPGWLVRVPGSPRSNNDSYVEATDHYTGEVGKIIADAQITNGGPVILFQPENEYQNALDGFPMPDVEYWKRVVKQYKDAGIVVPYINNESHMRGYISTNTEASVDIYGHDNYPLGFDCENPSVWPEDGLPTDFLATNNEIAPESPYTIPEAQGGGFQYWISISGFEACALLLNMEFERVLYKNYYSFGTTIFNIYMASFLAGCTFGGTNYGNLGHAEGFTSYDYGAQITEARQIWREKYSEVKLQANFFHVSPAFLEADRFGPSLDFTDNEAITVTPATTNTTKFYISRHTQYDSTEPAQYRLTVNTVDYGDIEIPQLGDSLVLNRRDSKIHVSDYPVGDKKLIYSSAEVFTWKRYEDKTVLVLYGGPNEHHEIAIEDDGEEEISTLQGTDVQTQRNGDGYTIIAWDISDDVEDRKVVRVQSDFYIYLLNRNEAYNFWVPPTGLEGDYGTSDIILKAGYLVRSAQKDGRALHLVGDVNATTTIEIVGGAPTELEELTFNGEALEFKQNSLGIVTASVDFSEPEFSLPCFSDLEWKTLDSLPELSPDYDDGAWVDADLEESPNDRHPISTPVSLYAGDYGFNTGSVVFRGHFTANGEESTVRIVAQGGNAFGFSAWVGSTFLGSSLGAAAETNGTINVNLPSDLEAGSDHVLTVVMDHMGLHGNYVVGEDTIKAPRGILQFELAGHDASDVTWKITGNLGGEDYRDIVRGPLNEGGMYVERQGFHQPSPPSDEWEIGKPTQGLSAPGIAFYSTSFDLDIPEGYDIPLAFKLSNETATVGAYRVQLYVNGYQFGKFVPHIGPQSVFPVPEGILNHHGTNWLGITLWAMEEGGAKVNLGWDVAMVTETGYGEVELSEAPHWEEREGAY